MEVNVIKRKLVVGGSDIRSVQSITCGHMHLSTECPLLALVAVFCLLHLLIQ